MENQLQLTHQTPCQMCVVIIKAFMLSWKNIEACPLNMISHMRKLYLKSKSSNHCKTHLATVLRLLVQTIDSISSGFDSHHLYSSKRGTHMLNQNHAYCSLHRINSLLERHEINADQMPDELNVHHHRHSHYNTIMRLVFISPVSLEFINPSLLIILFSSMLCYT